MICWEGNKNDFKTNCSEFLNFAMKWFFLNLKQSLYKKQNVKFNFFTKIIKTLHAVKIGVEKVFLTYSVAWNMYIHKHYCYNWWYSESQSVIIWPLTQRIQVKTILIESIA